MAKELAADVSLLEMELARNLSVDQAYRAIALAKTSVPGEAKANFLREEGISTVQADVRVEAVGTGSMTIKAMVRVKLTYKGNVVRPSFATRRKINSRVHGAAQKHCAEMVMKEIAKRAKGE